MKKLPRGGKTDFQRGLHNVSTTAVRGSTERTVPVEVAALLLGGEVRLRADASSQQYWNWKRRGVPAYVVLSKLLQRMRDAEIPAPLPDKPMHEREAFQAAKAYTACVEMLYRLATARPTRERELTAVMRLLEVMTDWTLDDWQTLYRARVDHLIARLREEQKV